MKMLSEDIAVRCGRRADAAGIVRLIAVLSLSAVVSACSSVPGPRPAPTPDVAQSALVHNNLYATLYLQVAAEHKALSRVVYRGAENMLDEVLADSRWTAAVEQAGNYSGLPPAVIFDVDETVLDNSPYQATLIAENLSYRTEHWDGWVAEARAPAVPGAVEFSRAAVARGVTLLYVTNRRCIQRAPGGDPCPQRAETIANLVQAGFPEPEPADVYLRSAEFGFERDKRSRREAFARRYRLLMLFGDDLGDFLPGVKDEGIDSALRDALVEEHASRWGRAWFVLPNPSYGSWLDVLGEDPAAHLRPW